jgi:L-lactate dehydrogenase
MRIVGAILRDERTVLSVSTLVRDYYGLSDVCFSLPTVVARAGAVDKLRLELSESEIAALQKSAETLRRTFEQVENG